MVDFSELGQDDSADSSLHPRKIFNALPENEYQYPRDVQTEVWNQWHDSREDAGDSVIKMNTGSGKTIVGLLILKSCLNGGDGPAAYLCPDNYLAGQVREEAEKLGISVTNEVGPRFIAGDSILVSSIYKLVNGQSQFGVGQIDIPIESVVIDDVHACLVDTEQQFTLDLGTDALAPLLELFHEDLEHQSPGGLHEICRGDAYRELLVPYWAWQREIDGVRKIITEEASEEVLSYKWPLVNDVLEYASCFVSGSSAEVSLRSLPIDIFPSFEEAPRRIFMSATISDDSVLVSHFDAEVEDQEEALTPNSAGDAGDRLILMPQYLDPSVDDEEIREMASRYADEVNVVVIVPSRYQSGKWEPYADQILDSSNLDEGVEDLKNGHVGLTVLLNKYDGVDLPEEACRVLVIDNLPDARRALDRYDQQILYGSGHELTQPIQRIEQGMGRGVRSSRDYCAVVLMGDRLTNKLVQPGGIEKFTAATKTQYELSNQLNQQLEDQGIPAVEEAIDQFLDRDPEWVQVSKSRLSEVEYDSSLTIREEVRGRRAAFSSARLGNLGEAEDEMRSVRGSIESEQLTGLLMQEQAALTNMRDSEAAQAIQQSAVEENKKLLNPIEGAQYNRLSPTDIQGNTAYQRLQDEYDRGRQFPIAVNELKSNLRFGDVSYRDFEQALDQVGWLLGLETQRPEQEYGTGPDNLWRSQDAPFFVIECKNEAEVDEIAKRYCNQLAGHLNWVRDRYGKDVSQVPIIIHPARSISTDASPPEGMRVIEEENLADLRTALESYAVAISENWGTLDREEVAGQLGELGLSAGQFVERFSSSVRE